MVDRPYRVSHFKEQRTELMSRDARTERPSVLPERLATDAIWRAEALFQPRETSLVMNAGHSKKHIKTLAKSASDGVDLDPVAIAAFGDRWYLLDGHHRLEAYARAERNGPIPVIVCSSKLKGNARIAWAVALSTELNSKEKLPMSSADKADAAWRLTVLGGLSKAEVHSSSRASTSSIGSMRPVHASLYGSGRFEYNELQAMTWREALWGLRCLNDDEGDSKFGDEDEKRQRLIKKLAPAFNAHVPTGRLIYALNALKPGVIEELTEILTFDFDADMDPLTDMVTLGV